MKKDLKTILFAGMVVLIPGMSIYFTDKGAWDYVKEIDNLSFIHGMDKERLEQIRKNILDNTFVLGYFID